MKNGGMTKRNDLRTAVVVGLGLAALGLVVPAGCGESGGAGPGTGEIGQEDGAGGASSVAEVLEAARVYVGDQEFGKAEAVLRGGIGDSPSDHRLREALAEVLLQADDRAGALEQYSWLVEDGSESAGVAFAAGSLAAVLGDPERAARFHMRAAELDPTNADYPLHLARAQIEMGQIEDAKVNLTRAAVLDDGLGTVWGMLGELALRENKLDLAAQHVTEARRLEPSVVAWRVLEARILKRRGEPERALMLLAGLTGSDRNQPAVLKAMGECLGLLDRGSDALALYEVAIEAEPAVAELRLEAALWAERLGKPERALELAEQARMMGDERAAVVIERLGG